VATRTLTPEHRANISKTLTGRRLSAEHCAHIGDALRGRSLTVDHRAKISAARTRTELEARDYRTER
jgi:hypothetical protein